MKKLLLLICLAMTFPFPCLAGALIVDPLTIPVLIAHDKGTGSGCFLQLSNSVYLVTARHVLFSEPEGANPPKLLSTKATLTAYSQAGTTNVSERVVSLDLGVLMNAGEIRFSTNRDIVLVRVEDCNPTNKALANLLPGIKFELTSRGFNIPSGDYTCPIEQVDVGADVYMFGYPISLTAPIRDRFDPDQPLLRKGIVAGVSLNRRTIVVDSPAYQGNSGGPVLQVEHPDPSLTRYRMIGVVSAFVPFEEQWENKTLRYAHVSISNSGYTLVEPIDFALELVWK
jgi:hypothetical protein